MLRILLLGPLPPPYGGPEVMTETLVSGLRLRSEVEVRHVDTQVSRSLAEKGGKHQARKSIRGAIQAIIVAREIRSYRPDVVYMPLTNSPSFLGFLRDALFMVPAILSHRRLMIRLHGGYYFYAHRTGWQRRLVGWVLGRVSVAMVQGERLFGEFCGLVPRSRITLVPNGLDDAPFAEARARNAGRPVVAVKQVLFVGLMCRDKGLREVIEAIPQVPGAHFVFAGEWPSEQDRCEVEEYLTQRGVRDRATFAGVVSGAKKYDLFVTSDIFVFPTYFVYEGHAVSSVEALAAGLPIVCTDHGALNESVRDGWNGWFVPLRDAQAVAGRLNVLLASDELRRLFGRRSRQLYEERFTLERFIETWITAVSQGATAAVAAVIESTTRPVI